MSTSILYFISLIFLSSAFAAVFQHAVHRRESLGMQLKKQGRWREYAAYKEQQLHGKFSNFKSTSQNIGGWSDYLYYVNITIGTPEQFFTLWLYSGNDMVLSDVNCHSCTGMRKFNSSKSSTYKPTDYSYYYGIGVYGQDVVRFGSPGTDQLVIPNAMFVQAEYDDSKRGADGRMGLGFKTDNPDADPPIIAAIKSGILDSPVVTLYLKVVGSHDYISNAGVITYGAVDTVNCDHNVIYEPLVDLTYIIFPLEKVSFGSTEFSGNWSTMLNIPSDRLSAPNYIVEAFAKQINATDLNGYDSYSVDCGVKFNFNLTIGSMVYTMTEKELVTRGDDGTCGFVIVRNNDEWWTLGGPWFSVVCHVLDYGNKRIGFAKVIA